MGTTSGWEGWLVDDHGQWYSQHGDWIARVDSATQRTYYHHLRTKKTQWEMPAELMQSSPAVQQQQQRQQNQQQQKEASKPKRLPARCLDFSHRPAKYQVDPDEAKKTNFRPEGTGEYNIWFGRYVGEMWNEHHNDGPAPYRCDARKDSGFTKATLEGSGMRFFCIFFAKGCCHLGPECGFLHRVPRDEDMKYADMGHDVFGRDRHHQHNTTMSGVGSIEKDCKTLYVGNLHARRPETEEELKEDFGEWGEIEKINIIRSRNIAFVTFKHRINAEFAKVAMGSQQLGGHTLLNVRWAYDDPNPRAQLKRLHDSQSQMLTALHDRAEYGPEVPAAKRLAPESEGTVTGPYPDTTAQYAEDEEVDQVLKREEAVQQQVFTDCARLDGLFRQLENKKPVQAQSGEPSSTSAASSGNAAANTRPVVSLGAPPPKVTAPSNSVKAADPDCVEMTASTSQVPVVNKSDPTRDPFRVSVPR